MTECVDTIAKLKSLTLDTIATIKDLTPTTLKELVPETAPCVIVEGYHKPGDGGGGAFFWDRSFNVDLKKFRDGEDFGTVIKPTWIDVPSKSGRWRRIFDGPISVKWFGAKGDFNPETGKGGENDTDAIQQAINVAKETGHTVYLSPGRFLITKSLSYKTVNVKDGIQEHTYQLMRHGLQMFGAGAQATFLHNQIKDGGATIIIDGAEDTSYSFQQTGFLKHFHITSTGKIPNTIGIDMRATWAYTIQNVHVMNMGSDAIILRNDYLEGGISDGDACENVYLDNVFAYNNGGWGIIVKAGDGDVSTGFLHIERCKLTENKGGGIQWTGQMGMIERCGLYGNGVYAQNDPRSPTPEKPTAIPGAYGILVKNVKATSNGLLISGCEIQGNADVQVMVESGANMKIIQNEFKVDDLSVRSSFPSIDIQVGDGNMDMEIGGIKQPRPVNACVIEDNRIRVIWNDGWGTDEAKINRPKHTVVKVNTNAIGTSIGRWWTGGWKRLKGDKLVELVEKKPAFFREGFMHLKTHLHTDGTDGGHILLPFASKRFGINDQPTAADPKMTEFKQLTEAGIISVASDKPEVTFTPDTSQWANFYIIIGGTFESIVLANPTVRTVGAPLFFEFINSRSGHPVTLTFGSEYFAGEGIVLSPSEIVSGIMIFDETYHWRLYTPWTCQGVPLRLNDGVKPPESKIL